VLPYYYARKRRVKHYYYGGIIGGGWRDEYQDIRMLNEYIALLIYIYIRVEGKEDVAVLIFLVSQSSLYPTFLSLIIQYLY
jgi:hypothetical protein